MACIIQKGKTARTLTRLNDAREKIELFDTELGRWPVSLAEAYQNMNWPGEMVYCTATNDANKGHGNEWCTFFDSGNPSGKNEHGGLPGVGYILATPAALAVSCQNINFVYTTCCGGDPIVVDCGETVDIGHPAHGPFNDFSCDS